MSTRGAPPWTCPWCERVVPGRETRCHCGCDRALALARDAPAGEGQGGGRAVLVVALVALGGLVLYAAARRRSQGAEAAALAASQRAEPSATPEMPSSGPPPGDFRAGAPAYVPAPAWISPPPRGEAHPPAVAPTVKAAEAASPPSLSALEEAWEKASALLEPRLEKIAMDSSSIESSYYPFATLCLAPEGAEAGAWLLSLKSAPYRGGSGIIITETGGRLDCSSARASLIARANQVKAQLGAAEDLARTSSVLPGHWRKLVAAHQLEIWDRY